MSRYRKRNNRLWVTDEEKEIFKGIQNQCEAAKLNVEDVKHGWLKTKESSLFFKNPNFGGGKSYEELRDELITELKEYSPSFPEIKRTKSTNGNCLVIDPADVHIGKLCMAMETGEDYNSQIAVKRVKEGI